MSQAADAALLPTQEVARLLRVDPQTIRRWVKSAGLRPALRLPGGQFRFRLTDVMEWMGPRPVRARDEDAEARVRAALARFDIRQRSGRTQ